MIAAAWIPGARYYAFPVEFPLTQNKLLGAAALL